MSVIAAAIRPSAPLWIAAASLLALGLWSLRYVPLLWRGGDSARRVTHYMAVLGEPLASSLASLLPFGSVYLLLGASLLSSALLARSTSGILRTVIEQLSSALVVVFAIAMLMALAIVLAGRPRVLIPPHLRVHRGIAGEAFAALVRRARDPGARSDKS